MERADVVVVGGGVVGASIAYYAARRGMSVKLIEQGEVGGGCSYGNAGLVVPSYSVPVSTPTALLHGTKGLFDPRSPFAIRLRPDPALLGWLVRFVTACRPERLARSIAILSRLGTASLTLHEQLSRLAGADYCFDKRGWLYVCKSRGGLAEEIRAAQLVGAAGIRWQALDPEGVRRMEPTLRRDLIGGVYFPDDAHLDPYRFVRYLRRLAEGAGAQVITNRQVFRLESSHNTVEAAVTADGDIVGGVFVIATGAWTNLTRGIGLHVPVQPARGYSFTFTGGASRPHIPIKLAETHVVVTPIGSNVRITGGLELMGFAKSKNRVRVAAIKGAPRQYLTALDGVESSNEWFGYRPLTPDGLPIVGPTRRLKNLVLATGHGTLGITLAPVTGSLIAEHLSTGRISADLVPLLPARFGM